MATPPAPLPRLLFLFAFCNFVIGTGAFGLSGILGAVAQDLHVSVAAAGQTMTVYALANALLAPLLMVLTGRWPRRAVMNLALAMVAGGALLCALASHLHWLLVGRVLMGLGAVFTPLAAGVAVALVPPPQRGRALSLTFIGMSLSYVLGIPLGAWLGLAWGWRWPMFAVSALALLSVLLISLWVPSRIDAPGASFAGLGRVLRQRTVALPLLMTLLYFAAIFTVSAYMGPVLMALNPLSPTALSWVLLCFGVAGTLGTLLGGWANDRYGPLPTLRTLASVLCLAMLLAPFTAGHTRLMVVVFMGWSMSGFGMMSPQQFRLASLAPEQTPMLLGLNASMLYLGTALGAAAGGAAIPWLGFGHLSWLGAVFMGTAWLTLRR